MPDALHVQVDLFLTGGTYHNAQCRYANYAHRAQPLYPARIESFAWSEELPDPRLGGLAKRSASITFSDKDFGRKDAPTLAAILATENPKGKRARLRAWDPATQQVIFTLNGIISSIGQDYRTLTIEGEDPALLQTPLPVPRALEYYPSADTSFCESKDPPIMCVFGPMPRVTLPLALATQLTFMATMGGAQSDKYVYADLSYVPNYLVASGDRLTYDIRLNDAGARQALDLRCTDGTTLRSTAAVDQNNLAVSPSTNLDAYAVGKFYRREIDLAPIHGKTISEYMLGCENDAAGTYTARIANAHVVDSLGIKKVTIFDENIVTPTIVYQSRNDTATTASSTRNAQWDFGPIRSPATGTLSAIAVYVDGRVRDPGAYTLTTANNFHFVRFTARPLDAQGRAAKVQADLDSTEFGRNPANICKFVWSDTTMLNKTVNAAAFTAAAAAYAAIGNYEKVIGGLAERKTALQILRDLTFRSAYFDLNDSGEVTMALDTAALHPAAPVSLGQNDALKLNNARLESNNALSNSIADQTRQLDVFGYRDPGLGLSAQESFLISATRSRVVGGAVVTRESPHLGEGKMADKETDYLFKLLASQDFDIEVSTGVQIGKKLALAQLVKFYSPKHYFSGSQSMIRRIRFDGKKFALRLTGYDPTLFTYGAGKVTASRLVDSLIDYSQTTPSSPTSPSYISSSVYNASDGRVVSIEKFRVTLPSVNCTELHVFAYRTGTGQIDPFATVLKKTVALGTTNDIEIEVAPGTAYDIEFYTYAGNNNAEFRYSPPALITGRVAAGDTTGPGDVANLQLADQPPRSVKASWDAASGSDVKRYRLQIYLDAGLTSLVRALTVDATEAVIGELTPGTSYWIRVRGEDWSGNPGNWSAAVGVSLNRLATNDYGVGSVTDDRIVSLGSTKITGNLTINPIGNIPALTVTNGGDIKMDSTVANSSRIGFYEGATLRMLIDAIPTGLNLVPSSDNYGSLNLGSVAQTWNHVAIAGQTMSLVTYSDLLSLASQTNVNVIANQVINLLASRVLVSGEIAGWSPTALSPPQPFSSYQIKAYVRLLNSDGSVYGLIPIV